MFFLASKLLAFVTQPLYWLVLWWAAALLMLRRWPRRATAMLWAGLLGLGLLGFEALPNVLLHALESRYRAPAPHTIAGHAGIIVLGGAIEHPSSYLAHNQVPLGAAAERMTVPVGLLRQYPALTLVFSGGEGRLQRTGVSEANLAQVFYQSQGLDMQKIHFETKARTTRENAQQVAQLLGPRCQESWLLVTSAWHMPRSLAEFDAVGCRVTPYPVDFRTGNTTPLTQYSLANSLVRWQVALHEWVGWLAYRLTR